MSYSKIMDPITGKNVSIYNSKGKEILNNYFKVFQDFNQKGGDLCTVQSEISIPTNCFSEPDMSGYTAPCGQLPLDNAFMNYKGGKSKRRRERKTRKNQLKSKKYIN